MFGYVDADNWRLREGWFEFLAGDEVKARYPELSVLAIRRTGDELELIQEYPAPERAG
ncbi:hypothetical protein [Roseimicrobium sp. ORNL1]|uniref:hypothetical protein n=1 Tax=Roseimicrobium sp. ORNL1 TaxID=2711231 RepID=UPI0013E1007A|nr:hypothetical protein [Roseimicrobium sp. ORNL1]QIF03633.1 hypothetical protein G5S37_19600 [Roseimicrobium sp. ORNL1]